MDGLDSILQLLQTGGDVGLYLLLYIGWRFERRLFMIEVMLAQHLGIDVNDVKDNMKRGKYHAVKKST